MKLLVVIINYRTPDLTLASVGAVLDGLAGLPGSRVVVIENGSEDGSLERIVETVERERWDDRVSVVASPRNGGFAYGVNLGARPALESDDPPDYVLLINSDATPAPDAIDILTRFMDEHPEVGIAGSYIHGPDGETHYTAFRFPSLAGQFEQTAGVGLVSRVLARWVVSGPVPSEASAVDWLAGASMMIRRQVFETIGMFDENYFLYFEETDFCRRAARAGWPTWYVPESRVEHIGCASTGWKDFSRPRPAFWFHGRRYYFFKNHGRLYLWAANLLWVVGSLIGRVWARLRGKQYPAPRRFFPDFLRYNFGFAPLPSPEGSGIELRGGAGRAA